MGCSYSLEARIPKDREEPVGASAALRKMVRTLGSAFTDSTIMKRLLYRSLKVGGRALSDGEECASATENNKLWLLADSRGREGSDATDELPPSALSSFRISFGSQVESEELLRESAAGSSSSSSAAAAVLLLVSMEEGEGNDAQDRRQQCQRLESLERNIYPVAGSLIRFSYFELRAATRDFRKDRELGMGGISRVYRGTVGRSSFAAARKEIAVKKIGGKDKESIKAFCRELTIASSLCHRNVVELLGFCVDAAGLFLVYEFICGGTLDFHLHQHTEKKKKMKKKNVMSLELRYKVAVGVASALEHLHYSTEKCVVHRDIKPSNILISSSKTAKLCDFGLATWIDGPSLPFLCKSVKGTFGYLAPEYFQHGKLSDKTDIYAFGVVLLELITGRPAIKRTGRPQGEENVVLWAKPLLQLGQNQESLAEFVDPRLKLGRPHQRRRKEMMSRLISTAAACITTEESQRPNIHSVLAILQGDENNADCSAFAPNGFLDGYGSRHHDINMDKHNIGSHLALAMLGVSDSEEDDLYCL